LFKAVSRLQDKLLTAKCAPFSVESSITLKLLFLIEFQPIAGVLNVPSVCKLSELEHDSPDIGLNNSTDAKLGSIAAPHAASSWKLIDRSMPPAPKSPDVVT